mmetsp:Transcript_26572/g.77356  ORF Transcript_26572/g.77356 Transcript_26572/m.77356 type:complete len:237 (+) Transcript_26572:332-1042(+)
MVGGGLLCSNGSGLVLLLDGVAFLIHGHELIGGGVEDLEDIIDQARLWFASTLGLFSLQQHLDIAQLLEVEIPLLLNAVEAELELRVALLKGRHFGLQGSHRCGRRFGGALGRAAGGGWLLGGAVLLVLGDQRGGRRPLAVGTGGPAHRGPRRASSRGPRGAAPGTRRVATKDLTRPGCTFALCPGGDGVVAVSDVVAVTEALEPLHELEVILVLASAEPLHLDHPVDLQLVHARL